MRLLIRLFQILISLTLFSSLSAQDWPEDWMGTYEGIMYIYVHTELRDSADLRLELREVSDSSWSYVMTYSNETYGEVVKDYLLLQPDSLPAHTFLMDEKNGLYIPETLIGNTMYSTFDVAGNRLSGMLSWHSDGLYWEIYTAPAGTASSTTSDPDDQARSFTVDSYIVRHTQNAWLRRLD